MRRRGLDGDAAARRDEPERPEPRHRAPHRRARALRGGCSGRRLGTRREAEELEPLRDDPLASQPGARRDDLVELLGHDLGRLEAVDRQLLDRPHHDALERRGHVGGAPVEGHRRVAADAQGRRTRVGLVAALEGAGAAEHLVEDDAEREHVAPRVDRLAEDLLGRHVRGRPQRRDVLEAARAGAPTSNGAEGEGIRAAGRLRLGLEARCDAEVEDLHVAAVAHEHVGRLDVAVDDPVLVRVGEAARDEGADHRRRVGRHGGPLLQQVGEAVAVDELEHEVHLRLVAHVSVQETDVRVAKLAEDLRLALELRGEGRRRSDGAPQDLDGDGPPDG